MANNSNAPVLVEVKNFGSNPGSLKCHLFLPTILTPSSPLVVVLHGCTQTAAAFDHGSGWSKLAEEKGFAVLYPEQQRANNPNLCFNWFEPVDTRRGSGEALSIQQMIAHVVLSQGLDADRVFICGLSAGGAMANVMLATYPELFAAGAIIGGLPFGVASSVGQAFERMHGRNPPTNSRLRENLRAAASAPARRPKISIWHGTHDQTVKPINAEQIAVQWTGDSVSGTEPDRTEANRGYVRKVWCSPEGDESVEMYLVAGMGHGVPLSSNAQSPIGHPGPFMLESGISSTARIARAWGLVEDADVASAETPTSGTVQSPSSSEGIERVVAKAFEMAKSKILPGGRDPQKGKAVGDVINDALRAAGLLR